MIDVTMQTFEQEVLLASIETPVLVDFWAPWCGPCKSLGPVLEKLEEEYGGRFILAKIDTEAQPQLAQAFGIRSIPTVILVKNGQPVDGFAGALPQGQVKEFLDKHLPSEEAVQAEHNKQEAAELANSGDADAALLRLEEALATNSNDEHARAQYVELLLSQGNLDKAKQAWEPLAPLLTAGGNLAARPAALKVWIDALEAAKKGVDAKTLQAAVEKVPRDFAARFALAQHWLAEGEKVKALDELLEIIMRDKTWHDEAARKAYIGILELLTPQKAAKKASEVKKEGAIALERKTHELDPQQQLVADYRRRLSMALN
ncbi:MAG: thioredoxin [Saezia sp.]